MELVIGVTILTCLVLALTLPLLLHKVAASGGTVPVTPEWIDELSIERYLPMIRLLDGEDLEFLRAQPGFTSEMVAKLRLQRCQIFREYLRCLNADFGRVSAAMKILILQSRNDRPDLAAALVRHQAAFLSGMLVIRFRLFLYRWGLGAVDVTDLVKVFEKLRLELRSLVPVAQPENA